MDKNVIKRYSVWARRELISRVSQRAAQYEITADGYGDQNAASVHGRILSADEKKQRSALIAQIREKGYEQVMEEIAYTWFNRFSALRFMEVNGYLPSRIRVFTNDDNAFKPQILDEAINIEMDGLDMQRVYELKNANDDDALFKYMIITQCNALASILPGMFQRISDYTELLFPDNLLREGSVVEQMIAMIPQEDWTDQVQIIGWLYQYYNTEPKDQVFANLKKNIKISKENIPAATQLFTPDWIVRYMVENSIGRLWLEGHPNNDLKAGWKYYLDEAEQEPEVQARLAEIRKEYAALKPEDILAIDPCQGSGHILAYMFDVLVQIYEAYGYSAREAASSIVEHNIWGLDIDERAAQLAYFSVMMKARQYDRRFFSRGVQPHVYSIQESNNLDPHCIEYFVDGREELKSAMDTLVKELHDAKEYGSILNVTQVDFAAFHARFDEIRNEAVPSIYSYQAVETLLPFVQMAQAMAQKYHAVATNPPYMGTREMNSHLVDYTNKFYPDSKADLCTVFMERCRVLCEDKGFFAMINIPSWMFLTSFQSLRKAVIENTSIVNMIHFGRGVFGADFGTTAFSIRNSNTKGYLATYLRLFDKASWVDTLEDKEKWFFERKGLYISKQEAFANIPGSPIAYWVSDSFIQTFQYPKLGELAKPRQGMATSDNNRFMRYWYEVAIGKICFDASDAESAKASGKKWFPYNKGGEFRKWYGNNFFVLNWENDGEEIKALAVNLYKCVTRTIKNIQFYFQEGITWTTLSIGAFSARYASKGALFDTKGSTCFFDHPETIPYVLAFLNSKVVDSLLSVLAPSVDYNAGSLAKLPVFIDSERMEQITKLTNDNISISKEDWNSFETSWDFKEHPFITSIRREAIGVKPISIKQAFEDWERTADERFRNLKQNEERLNHNFIDIYGLIDELTPHVEDKDVTVRRADIKRDIRSFISYVVGCMFGRYSLDTPGLVYAGGTWDATKYAAFLPDKDAILPICDDEYFEDDIVGRFIKFVEVVYGKDSLEENLRFIADVIGGKGSSREVIRNYFINDFYADHLKVYQKRPIYWLFDSGKKNGFKCLIYMHRYQPDTIARIRTDYVHEQQSRYRTAIADLESRVANAGTGERVKLTKRLDSIKAQAEELRVYEEKIHHLADQMIRIDLDDGVKVNYAKFQDVLAKIK